MRARMSQRAPPKTGTRHMFSTEEVQKQDNPLLVHTQQMKNLSTDKILNQLTKFVWYTLNISQ